MIPNPSASASSRPMTRGCLLFVLVRCWMDPCHRHHPSGGRSCSFFAEAFQNHPIVSVRVATATPPCTCRRSGSVSGSARFVASNEVPTTPQEEEGSGNDSDNNNNNNNNNNVPVPAPAPAAVTLYDVLGCERNATRTELKRSYLTLAKRYHPDAHASSQSQSQHSSSDNNTSNSVNTNNSDKFTEISTAWNILGDKKSRKRYDRTLAASQISEEIWQTTESWGEAVGERLQSFQGFYETLRSARPRNVNDLRTLLVQQSLDDKIREWQRQFDETCRQADEVGRNVQRVTRERIELSLRLGPRAPAVTSRDIVALGGSIDKVVVPPPLLAQLEQAEDEDRAVRQTADDVEREYRDRTQAVQTAETALVAAQAEVERLHSALVQSQAHWEQARRQLVTAEHLVRSMDHARRSTQRDLDRSARNLAKRRNAVTWALQEQLPPPSRERGGDTKSPKLSPMEEFQRLCEEERYLTAERFRLEEQASRYVSRAQKLRDQQQQQQQQQQQAQSPNQDRA